MQEWNYGQYMKFEKERTRPSIDLISRIDILPKTILDVGCGPGNSTNVLHMQFPNAYVLGIDNSDNMLSKAKKTYSDLEFAKLQIPEELDNIGKFDLIFSNACLHWIPNHKELLPKLMSKLNSGGMLAVQVTFIQNAPFYKLLNGIAKTKWKKLKNIEIFHSLMPNEIYDILSVVTDNITMWETTYYHILRSHGDVIEWYKGSGLRSYLDALDSTEKEEFLEDLYELIKDNFPLQKDDSVILKMPRVFYTAYKK